MAAPANPLSDAELRVAFNLDIFDGSGKKIKFSQTLAETASTIVIFIRHFFCGTCKMYVEQLATVRPNALKEANTSLIVIGCGDWKAIRMYAESSGFRGPIYADPSRKLYHALSMDVENLSVGETRPKYLRVGPLQNLLSSVWTIVTNPSIIGSQGKLTQLGGDFIFNADKKPSFVHIMENTTDHTEVDDLMRTASVEYP